MDPAKRKIHLTAKGILVNESYPVVSTYDPEDVGKVTEGVVVSMSTEGILLQLFGEVRGWVPRRYISAEGPIEYPEKLFFIGQSLKCKVMDVDPAKARMTLSLIIGGTSKPLGSKERKSGQKLDVGKTYACKVAEVTADGLALLVDVGEDEAVKAHLPKQHLTDHAALAGPLLATYAVGDAVHALCFERDVVPIMTCKPFILEEAGRVQSFDDLDVGTVLPGVVCLVKDYGVFLRLPTPKFKKSALIPTRHLADSFIETPQEFAGMRDTLFAKVIDKDEKEQRLTLSSKLKDVTRHPVRLMETLLEDLKRIQDHSSIAYKVGDVVQASVVNVTEFGAEAALPDSDVRALVPKSSLEGADPPKKGQTVHGVVLYVDNQFNVLELSLNPDVVTKVTTKKAKHLPKEEQTVKATVVLRRSELGYALCCIKTPSPLAGHLVYVPTRNHINDKFGFADDLGPTCSLVIQSSTPSGIIGVWDKQDQPGSGRKRQRTRSDSEARHRQDSTSSDVLATPPAAKKSRKGGNAINLSVLQGLCAPGVKVEVKDEVEDVSEKKSVQPKKQKVDQKEGPAWDKDYNPWEVDVKEEPDSETEIKDDIIDATSGGRKKKHLSKKEAKALSKLEDAEISRVEGQVISGNVNPEPQTAQDFDKLVLGSPDSSLCWIKYMAFYLGKKDYEKAREIAQRALEKINFRLETERLNVYMAWFNLENSFGSEETAERCLKDALKCNDAFKVYVQAAAVYDKLPDKQSQAEKLYKTMARKYGKEPEAWALLGRHYFLRKDLKEARFTLQRALQNLDKKGHVEVSSRFGVLEFKHGESERGKSIFENIVSNFPRRTDQWNVYIEMVTKNGELQFARELFDRMIGLNLQPKKMKSIFKRYLDFETVHGNQQSIDQVRKKALEYVESKFGKQSQEEDDLQDPMDQLMEIDDD